MIVTFALVPIIIFIDMKHYVIHIYTPPNNCPLVWCAAMKLFQLYISTKARRKGKQMNKITLLKTKEVHSYVKAGGKPWTRKSCR